MWLRTGALPITLYYDPLLAACPHVLSSSKEVIECTLWKGGGVQLFVASFFISAVVLLVVLGGTDGQSFPTNLESKIDNMLKKKPDPAVTVVFNQTG